MPVIAETAYPRLPAEPEPAELEAFTPEPAEIAFARQKTRQPGPRLALLVLLKTFQRLGRVVRFADVPTGIIDHIAAAAGLASNTGELVGYGDTTYRVRLAALVRGYVGVTGYDRAARGIAARACIEAARTRDDLADVVNAGIEELLRHRRELPAFGTLLKLARTARALVNRSYHRRIAAALPPDARERLAALLVVPEGANRSGWDQVKADPPRPSPQRMREHLAHLAWLRGQAAVDDVFSGVPDRKLRHFAAEARSLGAADLGRVVESKRFALIATLLRGQVAQTLDDAAEMFVRLMTRMHNRAREALDKHRARHAAETDALIGLLRETVLACQDQEAGPNGRLSKVESLLLPDADAILAKCEAHAAFAGSNYLPLLELPAPARALLRRSARGLSAFPGPRRPSLHLAGPRHRAGDRLLARTPHRPPRQAADHRGSGAGRRRRCPPAAGPVLGGREVVAVADRANGPGSRTHRGGPAS